MEHLFDKLMQYGNSDMYPLHMPGHKRNACGNLPEEIYKIDITEIDGFDNLHQPEEILADLQRRAANLYGAEESFYLVNGSTCGILAAISAAVRPEGKLLISRNCHKSVYHGAYLRRLELSYLMPEIIEDYGICEAVSVESVKRALEENPKIEAVLVVSPTYEGRIADIESIAKEVHRHDIPLIVDEAHGAHLGLSDVVAQNSCRLGADLVIHSVHKTLPAMTQTALLHVNGNLIDRDRLRRFLRIYQSSSPSYVLMASIDNALTYMEKHGKMLFRQFRDNFFAMCDGLAKCKNIRILSPKSSCQDVGKLVISVKHAAITGIELYNILREKYGLQLELAAEDYVLAMFTVNDTQQGFDRTTAALLEIDADLEPVKELKSGRTMEKQMLTSGSRVVPMWKAWDAMSELVPISDCAGRIAADFVNIYPPGVPVLVPGEQVLEQNSEDILRWIRQGLNVQGIVHTKETESADGNLYCIKVLSRK